MYIDRRCLILVHPIAGERLIEGRLPIELGDVSQEVAREYNE